MKKMIMKKSLLFLLLALMTSVPMLADVIINETNFPDPYFRNFLLTNEDPLYNNSTKKMGINGYGKDGKLTTEELGKIYFLNISGLNVGGKISNLKGIEHFYNLTYLICNHNNLQTVDLSQNTRLMALSIGDNNLQSLNISNLTNLYTLMCENNALTSLDVSNNPNLLTIWCTGNPIISLVGLSNKPYFITLRISDIESVDISGVATTIRELEIDNTSMTSIDLSACSALQRVVLNGNNYLNSITLPTNTAKLRDLNIYDNPLLESLNVSAYTGLERLVCNRNGITSLDVSNNTALKVLDCRGSNMTSLDVSHNTALKALYCDGNRLTSLDVSNNTALTSLGCCGNHLTELDLSHNTQIVDEYDAPNNFPYFYNLSFYLYASEMNTGIGLALGLSIPTYHEICISPQYVYKDYVAIDGRSKLGLKCNTNNGVLTSYKPYGAVKSSDDNNNYIVMADEAYGKTDYHAYRDPLIYGSNSLTYGYETGYTGDCYEARSMTVNVYCSAHGMYVHPETLRGSDNFYSGTLYLEFPARIPEGVQCYYAKGLDANEDLVGLTEVTGTIPANTAVIVKAPSEYKFFAFNESDETPAAPTDNIIEGTIEGLSVAPGTVLTLGHNVDRSTGEYDNFGFWNYRGNWINPFRAYIPKSSLAAGAKNGFSLVFPEDGTTGIARLTNSDTTEDGTWYTLSGIRLTAKPTAKGIYVNGGKKVVIK